MEPNLLRSAAVVTDSDMKALLPALILILAADTGRPDRPALALLCYDKEGGRRVTAMVDLKKGSRIWMREHENLMEEETISGWFGAHVTLMAAFPGSQEAMRLPRTPISTHWNEILIIPGSSGSHGINFENTANDKSNKKNLR